MRLEGGSGTLCPKTWLHGADDVLRLPPCGQGATRAWTSSTGGWIRDRRTWRLRSCRNGCTGPAGTYASADAARPRVPRVCRRTDVVNSMHRESQLTPDIERIASDLKSHDVTRLAGFLVCEVWTYLAGAVRGLRFAAVSLYS